LDVTVYANHLNKGNVIGLAFKSVYFFIFFLVCLTVPKGAYGFDQAFEQVSRGLFFEDSHRGYGHLAPLGQGSESGIVNHRAIKCGQKPIESEEKVFTDWELKERENIQFVFSLFLGAPLATSSLHLSFLELLSNKEFFYTTKNKYEKKIYSSNFKKWSLLPIELKAFSEKFFHLEAKALPSENIKAAILLDILETKEGSQFRGLQYSLENAFFLLDDQYRQEARKVVKALFRLGADEYESFIMSEKRFYLLGAFLRKVEKKIERSHKLLLKGQNQAAYKAFLNFHQSHLKGIGDSILKNGHPLVDNQAYAEGVLEAPSCELKALPVQCSSFKKKEDHSSLSSNFFLEYFKAWREYEVLETETAFIISLKLRFLRETGISQGQVHALLGTWTSWSRDFYNVNAGFNGKKVRFEFDFTEADTLQEAEDIIHIRKCWNAARNSSDCGLPSQPNAKNFTVNLKRDALLEEVGHHMGLFDEYRMPYYLFNALGAADSFMIAPENFKMYPSHLERILTPHLLCK